VRAAGAGRLLLSRYLLIAVTPCADFQAAAYPAEIFRGLRPGQRRADPATHRAPFSRGRALSLYGFFRQLQNLGRDNWLGRRFLFHSRLHYRTDRPRGEWALLKNL
jgi:hypothetical protein